MKQSHTIHKLLLFLSMMLTAFACETKVQEQTSINTSNEPVQIIAYYIMDKENSKRELQLTYQNISKKVIGRVRFNWTEVNEISEAATSYTAVLYPHAFEPGKQATYTTEIGDANTKNVTSAVVSEVVFMDDTVWKNGQTRKQ